MDPNAKNLYEPITRVRRKTVAGAMKQTLGNEYYEILGTKVKQDNNKTRYQW